MEVVSVGPFVLGRTLGTGATGKVKLGFHRDSGFKVAIKIIAKNTLQNRPQVMQKLEREIAIMKFLDHPNVLRLYDVYDTPNYLFLVLEHVEGGELFDYLLSKGKLSDEEALVFFQQLVDGLSYCHAHLICHRDLKPENILLDANRQVKICDFGMAALMPKDALLATSCGSPHYASPEVITGRKYDGMEADVWSLGVILYALLVGKLPFDDPNIRKLLLKVKIGVFEMPAWLDRTAKDLLWRMLTVDPDKRATIQEIKQHPWFVSNGAVIGKWNAVDQTAAADIDAQHLDGEVVQTLTALWGNEQAVLTDLLANGPNVTKVFYRLVEERFRKRALDESEKRKDDEREAEREKEREKEREREAEKEKAATPEDRSVESPFRLLARKSLSFFRPTSPIASGAGREPSPVSVTSPVAVSAAQSSTAVADDASGEQASPGSPRKSLTFGGSPSAARRASMPTVPLARRTTATSDTSTSPPESGQLRLDRVPSEGSQGSVGSFVATGATPERRGSLFRRGATPASATQVDYRLFTSNSASVPTSPSPQQMPGTAAATSAAAGAGGIAAAPLSSSGGLGEPMRADSPVTVVGASPRKSWFNFFVRSSKNSVRGYEIPPVARSFVSSLDPEELWVRAAPILDALDVAARYSKNRRCLKCSQGATLAASGAAVGSPSSCHFLIRMTHVLSPRTASHVSYLHWELTSGSSEAFLSLFALFKERSEGVIPSLAALGDSSGPLSVELDGLDIGGGSASGSSGSRSAMASSNDAGETPSSSAELRSSNDGRLPPM